MSLWKFNKNIKFQTNINEGIKKIASINNNLFILTNNDVFYRGLIAEENISLTVIDKFKPLDIDSHKDRLYLVDSADGNVLICNEQLEILNSIALVEEIKCSKGHEGLLSHKSKVKRIAISEYGCLYLSETDELWGSGFMPQISVNNELPKKIVFFSGRIIHDIAIGLNFAVALVSKRSKEEDESIFEDLVCQICEEKQCVDECPLGVKLNNEQSISIDDDKAIAVTKNIIFRNTEAAKDFLTKQLSLMSSEYLIESNPTKIIKENVSNVATFVYEGVKTLSRHVSSSSECTENNNTEKTRKNYKEDVLLSNSQSSTSVRDLSEIELQENLEGILNKGAELLNREVWMWGDMNYGCFGNDKKCTDLPIIISLLSNLGVTKVSLQHSHCCAMTLDGRAYIWGENANHQVTMENNSDQISPKQFQSNLSERVIDAICGNYFTVILSNKLNLTYFGKEASSFQRIYHKYMMQKSDTIMLSSNNSLLVDKEYVILNVGPNLDDGFINFCTKEQIVLEEMLLMHHKVIKLLLKKSTDSVYDTLCKCYIDLLNFLAANVESLLSMNDIIIIKHFKEFIMVYKNYVEVVQNILCINGFEHISNTIIPKECDKTTSELLLNPLKKTSHYMDFYKKYSSKEVETKWKEFIDFVESKAKDSKKTLAFWQNNGKNIDYLKTPNRRFILDSLTDPINLQNSSRFSSHRFLLFSDIFAHLISSSNHHLHSLTMIWIWLDTPPHSTQEHLICLKMPEESLVLTAPDGVTKHKWFHSLQHAIKVSLNKLDLFQPPLARSGTYTFSKSGFFKDGTYTGRWLNGKMHGTGKFKWIDGRTYSGQFEHNFLDGFGVMDTPDVGIYEGEWKNNKPDGYGTFTYCNRDIYKGYFKNGYPHGHGLLRKGNFMTNSASLYIGEWESGEKSGYGIMDDISTGEKYLGFWAENKKQGSGLIVTSEGIYYEGNFHNDVLSGHGIMVLEDGSHYEGEFKGIGLVGGKGTLTLPTGHTIEGNLSGSIEQGIKINQGILRKQSLTNPKSFGILCTAPAEKWQAFFRHCRQVLGVTESQGTTKIWQNVAAHLAGASTLKRHKTNESSSLQNSLNNLDVIPPFGQDKISMESYKEIKTYLNRAFESNFHPLGNLLNNLCEAYISSYSGKIHSILVNHAILEIIDVTQRVYEIIRHLFPALPFEECVFSSNSEQENSKIIINYQTVLYPVILPKIYNCLCTLLSLKNETQERQYKKVLIKWNKLSDRSLMSVLCVEKKFFNLYQQINHSDKSCAFVEAIECLQQIITLFLPYEKLVIIRNTVEKMTPVARHLLGSDYVWNMDDLFPLFLYVVARARIPHLGAELEFMEYFMDKSLENGELGIMFTTLKACYQQILQDKSHFDM